MVAARLRARRSFWSASAPWLMPFCLGLAIARPWSVWTILTGVVATMYYSTIAWERRKDPRRACSQCGGICRDAALAYADPPLICTCSRTHEASK